MSDFNIDKLSDCFIIIPKEVIVNNSIDDKRILVFIYLAIMKTRNEKCYISCNHMINWFGYKPNINKGRINDKFKLVLKSLINIGYIKEMDIETEFKSNYLIELSLNEFAFKPTNNFTIIHLNEINSIKQYMSTINDKDISLSKVLIIFTYLRSKIYRRKTPKDKYPECFYSNYQVIADDLGVSRQTISKAVSILDELNIIHSEQMSTIKDADGNWKKGVTIFVDKYRYHYTGLLDDKYDYMREVKWCKSKLINGKGN